MSSCKLIAISREGDIVSWTALHNAANRDWVLTGTVEIGTQRLDGNGYCIAGPLTWHPKILRIGGMTLRVGQELIGQVNEIMGGPVKHHLPVCPECSWEMTSDGAVWRCGNCERRRLLAEMVR